MSLGLFGRSSYNIFYPFMAHPINDGHCCKPKKQKEECGCNKPKPCPGELEPIYTVFEDDLLYLVHDGVNRTISVKNFIKSLKFNSNGTTEVSTSFDVLQASISGLQLAIDRLIKKDKFLQSEIDTLKQTTNGIQETVSILDNTIEDLVNRINSITLIDNTQAINELNEKIAKLENKLNNNIDGIPNIFNTVSEMNAYLLGDVDIKDGSLVYVKENSSIYVYNKPANQFTKIETGTNQKPVSVNQQVVFTTINTDGVEPYGTVNKNETDTEITYTVTLFMPKLGDVKGRFDILDETTGLLASDIETLKADTNAIKQVINNLDNYATKSYVTSQDIFLTGNLRSYTDSKIEEVNDKLSEHIKKPDYIQHLITPITLEYVEEGVMRWKQIDNVLFRYRGRNYIISGNNDNYPVQPPFEGDENSPYYYILSKPRSEVSVNITSEDVVFDLYDKVIGGMNESPFTDIVVGFYINDIEDNCVKVESKPNYYAYENYNTNPVFMALSAESFMMNAEESLNKNFVVLAAKQRNFKDNPQKHFSATGYFYPEYQRQRIERIFSKL